MDTTVSLILVGLFLSLVLVYRMPDILTSLAKNQELRNRRKLLRMQQTVEKMNEVEYLRVSMENKDQEIQRLTNLLISRDPATFATIQATSSPDYSNSKTEYQPTGTDISEYNMWAAQNGHPLYQEPMTNDFLTDGVVP